MARVDGSVAVKRPFPIPFDRTAILLSAALLLGFAIRMLPLAYSIVGGRVIFAEFDPYYHMRRIVETVGHFPFVNSFDSYVNYPSGYGVSWPPLFDLMAAALSLLVGLGHPDRFTIEIVSATLPVILGVLSIALLYYIVKDALGKNAALPAAFFMAILPASTFRTLFGFVDHHALEVFISLAMYLLFMRAVAHAREEKIGLSNLPGSPRAIAYTVLAGLAMAGMVFSWDGAPIFIAVIVAYAFVQFAYDAFSKEGSDYLMIVGTMASLVALVAVAPFIIASQAGRDFLVSAMYLSWFHVIYLLGIALFFGLTGSLTRLFGERKAPWFSAPLTVALGAVLLLAMAWLFLPQMTNELVNGVNFLTGQGNILATVNEVESLFSYNGQLSYDKPWAFLSYAGILAVIGLAAYLFTRQWKKLKNYELFILVWTLIVLVLGLLQSRFIYLLAVNVELFAGFAIYKVLDLAGFYRPPKGGKADSARRPSRSLDDLATPPVVAVAIVSAMVVLGILLSPVALPTAPDWYVPDWNKACQWVDAHTPKTSFTYAADRGTRPEYGIMSWWDYGNYILYEAERPAVANNFQTGIPDAAHFFIAQDEASANAIMDRVGAKYVMLDYRLGSSAAGGGGVFNNMPYLAGEDANSYVLQYTMPMPYGDDQQCVDGNARYYGSMYSRLFNGDGLGGRDPLGYVAGGLQHYRLVYMTHGSYDPVKVFEYVKGATISGTATPGAKLEISLNVTALDGNHTYHGSTLADAGGAYAFTVPYPTSSTVGTTTTGAAYTITAGNSSTRVQVPASAVDNGGSVEAGGRL